MGSRGRHVGGARWFAIALLIAAALMAMPPRARADGVPVDPGALAQAGLAEAQHAVDLATAAVSAASPAVAVPAATPPPGTSVLPASARAAASPPATAPQPAAPPAAATSGGVSRVLRPPAPPVHSARAAGPHLPVSVSAARAGADTAPPVTPAEPVVTPPVAPVRIEPVAPVPIGPVASVPMPSMPVVPAPVIGAVPTVAMPAISIPWWPVPG